MTLPQPPGFLAPPAGTEPGPAVLVLHAWWGLNETIRTVCTRPAGEGFVAFALDLFSGGVEADEFQSAEDVAALHRALRAADRPATFHRYPGTGHWFFEPDRADAYREDAARLAWDRTISFLRHTLAPTSAR